MIGDINNVASYTMSNDSADVLCRGLSSPSVIERVSLICEETKDHARRYFKIMGEGVNPVFYAQIVIEHVTVGVVELGCISL